MPRKIVGAGAALTAAALAFALSGCGSTSAPAGASSGSASTATGGASFSTSACSSSAAAPNYSNGYPTVSGAAKSLSAAGSTFAAPAYSTWTSAYAKDSSTKVAYQSVGSGAGVQQIIANTIDFGDSDVPMNDAELAQAKGGAIVHIPVLIGAVVPAYHLQGVGSGLKFTGALLGQIFDGQIKTWNDPAIAKVNPGAKLPSEPIAVVHRSDGSGTTGIWTKYLTKTSPSWVQALGGATTSAGKTVAWPTGIGGKGNEGVAGQVQQTEGAIGYLELQYALAQNTTYGQVQNADGNAFVQPCLATLTSASDAATFPADLRGDLTNEPGKDSYPITGTTYALVYEKQTDKAKAAALVNFFSWVLTKGQDQLSSVNFSPVGSALQKKAMAQLTKITVNGTALVK